MPVWNFTQPLVILISNFRWGVKSPSLREKLHTSEKRLAEALEGPSS